MAEAIRVALDEARMDPEAIDYINAHGSGTKQNDRHETAAFKRSLGDHAYRTPVSSIKSMVGHSLGAIGSIEIAACALAIENNVVPPTANLHDPDPECDLDYVPLVAREHATDAVLTVGSGFGGFQSAMVLPPRADMTGAVVVTGIGVTAPGGSASASSGHRSSAGTAASARSRASTPSGYPAGLAGEVPEFEVEEHLPEPAASRRPTA